MGHLGTGCTTQYTARKTESEAGGLLTGPVYAAWRIKMPESEASYGSCWASVGPAGKGDQWKEHV